jgi:trans-2,3-dihydro-3-hydroxyanthranilate isomerase
MRHRDATFEPEVRDRAGVARALGLTEGDLLPRAPVQTVSTGNPFVFVPLRDRQVVDRSALDVATLLASFGETLVGVFVFAPDGEARVYSRMFAPHHGVPEDAATGSGSGPLIAYLVTHGLAPKGEHVRIVSEQGTKMGRQSFLHMTARAVDGRATEIRVGGGVVPVLEGRLELP